MKDIFAAFGSEVFRPMMTILLAAFMIEWPLFCRRITTTCGLIPGSETWRT